MDNLNICYEIIKDYIPVQEWTNFSAGLPFSFTQIPEEWKLNAAVRHRLMFQIQWEYFNPDLVSDMPEKKKISMLFMHYFLGSGFYLRWKYLLDRLESPQMEAWLVDFCSMETLLSVYKLAEDERLPWLMHFDTEHKFGKSQRVRIIKTRSLGLVSELLGVDKTMDWARIKSQYRAALKRFHPDHNQHSAQSQQIQKVVEDFQRLLQEKQEKEKQGLG